MEEDAVVKREAPVCAGWARRFGPLAALLAFVTCGGDPTARYDAPHDDAAMSAIVSRWDGADGVSVSLCEDRERSDPWDPGGNLCVVEHVVRGAGRTSDQVAEHGGHGCGGCPFQVVAYVRGTVAATSSDAPLAVQGEVFLQSGKSGSPYATPYEVRLQCTAPDAPCSLEGRLQGDGTLVGQWVLGAPGTQAAHGVLSRTGAASCDAAP